MKNIVPICDEGDLSNDRNSPLICSDFRSIRQDEEQRDFDDSAKRKIEKQKQKEEHKKKDKNDSDKLTEPIPMFSSFKANQRLQTQV